MSRLLLCLGLLAPLAACFMPTTDARFEVADGGAGRWDGGCRPSCGNRQCGEDGCGGSCGSCATGTFCGGGRCGACPESRKCQAACCSEGQTCVNGACAVCGCGDRECGTDLCGRSCGTCTAPGVCDLGPGHCVVPDVCKNVYCPAGTRCDPRDGACRCDTTSCPPGSSCGSDGQCHAGCSPACSGETPFCSPGLGRCECTSTSCSAGKVCNASTRTCQPAGCPQPCSAETPCDLSSRTCRCTSASCGAWKTCNAYTGLCESAGCWPPCSGETPSCNERFGTCACTSTSCLAGKVCNAWSGACQPADCSPPCSGETPTCNPARNRCECTSTSCIPGMVCNASTGACQFPACSPPCASGQRCVNGACVSATCSPACASEVPDCDPATLTCKCNATSCPAGRACGAQGTCVPSGPCDPAWQTGCAPGEGCYLDAASGSYRCLGQGTKQAGAPCQAGNECRAGADCREQGGTRICLEYCDPQTDVGCTYSQSCSAVDPWVGFCVACPAERSCLGGSYCCPPGTTCGPSGSCELPGACDPMLANSCPAGFGCYLYDYGYAWTCQPTGSLPEGAACAKSAECLPELGCFYLDGAKRCRKLCSTVTGASGCPAGQECLNVVGPDQGLCVECESRCGTACCVPQEVCSNDMCVRGSSCDPTRPGACPPDTGCYYDYVFGGYQCASVGTGALNTPCTFDWECEPGMGCLGPRFDVCLPYCSDVDTTCATGRDCVSLGDGYGWCG